MKVGKLYKVNLFITAITAAAIFSSQPVCAVLSSSAQTVPVGSIKSGSALDAAMKYPQAIECFTKAIKATPNDPKLYYWRGLSNFHSANYVKAVEDLSEAIKLDENQQDARLIRGTAFLEWKQPDKAAEDLEWVTSRNPQFKEAFQRLASAYESMGKTERAAVVKQQAAKMHYRSFVAEGEPSTPLVYMFDKCLEKQIKWKPPDRSGFMLVTIGFTEHRNHSLSDIKITNTSSDLILDKMALETIRKIKETGPLPPGSPEADKQEFTFCSKPFANAGIASLPEILQLIRIDKPIRLQKKGDMQGAANLFKQVLDEFDEKRPHIHVARLVPYIAENLADCYWRLSLSVRTDPSAQIQYLHQALFYRPYFEDYENDLNDAISQLGKDPSNALDRVTLGDEAMNVKDRKGAIIEYRAALKIKDDIEIRKKLSAIDSDTMPTGLFHLESKK